MKRFGTHVALSLTLLLIVPAMSWAAGIHYFNCTECHKSSLAVQSLATANVCLSCHQAGTYVDNTPAQGMDGQIEGKLTAAQASDALNNNPYSPSGYGTSHIWGAPANNAAAGAQEPATNLTGFFRRYQVSWGKVTCTRCHEPHADSTANPLAMNPDALNGNLPMTPEQLCRACHIPFDQQNNKGLVTHPVVVNYGALVASAPYQPGGAKEGWLQPSIGNGGGSGTVQRIDVTIRTGAAPATYVNGVGCTSCHGVHAADSDSTTDDGFGTAADTADGDGKLLRADGATRTGANSAATAQRRSNLCQACHTFKPHGSSGSQMGCLDCHSGHTYGSSNYFVLRNQVGATTNLNYTTRSPLHGGSTPVDDLWSGTVIGDTAGYCERCHGQLTAMPGSARTHIENENCRTCHAHDGATFSFEAAGGCDGCHGAPPKQNAVGGPNGFASGYTPFKDESATPHAAHAAGAGNYTFSCNACHLNNTHDMGTFQDVFLGVDDPLATGNGNMSPGYDGSGSGTCSNVYCHSNGGRRTSDVSRVFTAATIPVWAGGAGTITACNACHDNTASMTNGSPAHAAHLALTGVTCKTCHVTTAASATTLAAGAIGNTHVNNARDVAFDTSGFITVGPTPYNATTGVCAVYCHSNGYTRVSPDWDVVTSGDCGACHQFSSAGVATGAGTALSSAHNKHVYTSGGGVQLACTTCHTNAGSGADHVNGSISFVSNYQNTVCNPCHGSSNGVTTGDDRQPIWNSTASVDCQTCHAGSVRATVNSKVATDKSQATSTGHNRTTNYASGNLPASKLCASCHDEANRTGHLDGTTGDDMRLLAAAATCTTSCHGVGGSAVKDSIVTHKTESCANCHDPHGSSNLYMVKSTSARYAGTVVFTATTGADSYDEVDSGATANYDDICATCHTAATHNNRTDTGVHLDASTHEGEDCFTCHRPHTNPAIDGGAFATGAGNACNGCHGFPPVTGAHASHTLTASNDKDIEDRSDCEACHTGAASYTYNPATDRGNSLNHGNATGRDTILASKVGYNTTNFNCTSACHASTAADGFWSDTALNCNACHYYNAAPTAAGNVTSGNSEALGGDHSVHFGAGGIVTCANCHGTDPTDTTHISLGTGTDAQKYQDRALAQQDEADVTATALGTGSDPDPGNPVCNNAACHNPSGTTYSATWTVSAAACTLCHSSTNPGTGSHGQHMNAATTFGINTTTCTSCHPNHGTNYAHRSGNVTFAAGMNYTAGAVDVLGTMGTCTTSTCHNNGTAAATAVVTPTWGQASADCTICHGNAPATGEHAKHMANTTFVDGGCTDCHTAANATTHINSVRNIAGQITDMDLATGGNQLTAPGGWVGTCLNNCHIANTASDWTSGTNTLACTDCHGSGKVTTPAMDRGWPPSSGKHGLHTGSPYVAANCIDCHNNNTITHSTLNNVVTAIGGAKVSAYTANNCTNTCHVAADTNDWTAGTRACTDCHMVGKTGMYDTGARDQAPNSGLHATTAALAHDDNFGSSYTCTNCHSSSTPSAAHQTGTLQTSLQTTYTFTAQIGSYANPGGCASNCHKDGGDWKRKWIGVTDAAPAYSDPATAAVCANCHGSFAQGWNFVNEGGATTSDHTDPDPDNTGDQMNAGGHVVCSKCHGWGTAAYQSGNMHNNNLIAMNADLGYDNGTGNCAVNCHSGKTLTTNTNSGFTNESGSFGGVGCGSCHDDGTIPPNSGAHAAHGANADANYSECILCHGDNGDGYASTTGTHNDNSVTFAAGITYSNNGTPGTNANANDDTCSTSICHTGSGTVTWGATSLGCSECHYYEANPTLTNNNAHSNPLGGSHSKHFGVGGVTTCASCHTVPVAGDTTHINGATTLVDKSNATMDEATLIASALGTGSDPDAGNATCNSVACHNPSNGAYTATWTVANAVGCAFCHSSTNPGTGAHSAHMSAATNFGLTVTCTSCHPNHGTNNAHRSGNVTFTTSPAAMGYTPGAEDVGGTMGTCTTTTCHNNGLATPVAITTKAWNQTDIDCTTCHGNAPATGAHGSHVNATYIAGTCSECHTAANVSSHINGTRNMANKVSAYTGSPTFTCTNSCHIASTTGDWSGSNTLACTDCHGSGKVTTPAMDRGWPPNSNAHLKHTLNTQYVAANCVDCHNNNTVTHSTLNNVVTAAVGSKLSVNPANGSCTNSCHASAQAGDWSGGSAAVICLDCHSGSYIGGNNVAKGFNATPATGLHAGTLITSANTHDDSFNNGAAGTADCMTCHGTTPSTNHIDGTYTNSWNAVAPSINFAANVGFTDGTTPTCGPVSGLASCHDDGGVWKRKWSITAKNSDETRCANCHGDFDSGFVTGMAGRHQTTTSGDADGQIAAFHDGTDKCYTCHSYKAGDNTYYNIANSPVGQHRDGTIQINTNVGFADNGASVGCAKCHSSNDGTADEQHEFVDTTSRWTRNSSFNGPPVSCATCHAYPPAPGDGKTAQAVEGKGAHAKHVTHIAARAGVTLDPLNDTFTGATSTAVCGVCHNVSSGANHSTAGGTRNLLIPAASYQFGSTAPTYNGTVGQSSSVDPKSCSSVDCHFKETPVWAPVGGE